MADAGVGANLDIQVNVKTIADNSGQLTQELSSLSSKVAQITSGVARAEQSVASLSQTVASIGSSGVTSMGSLEGALKTLTTSVNSNIQASQRLSTQYQALGKQLNNLPAMAQGALGSTQRLAVQGAGAIGQQTVAVRNLQQAMGQMGQTGQSAFSGLGQQIFGSLYGIQFLIGQMQNALNAVERMDVLRASYARIMGADLGLDKVGSASAQMVQDAARIGQKYGASISDVAGTMVEFARQGRSAQDIRYLTDSLGELRLMLATSTGKFMTLSEAMKSATTLMTQMDLTVYESIGALKLMSEFDIRAATSFNEISTAMNRFSAAGKVAGMSTEEIIRVATAFTEIGIGGSRAGTAINAVLSRLSGNKEAVALISSMNVALTKMEDGTLRATSGWERLIEAYRKVMATGSSTQMNQFLTTVAGARQRAVLAAGLNRQLKQSRSPVSAREFAPMVDNMYAELDKALTSGSVSNVKTVVGTRTRRFDGEEIRQTLINNIRSLRKTMEDEFARFGSVKPVNLPSLLRLWFGATDAEVKQLMDANKPIFDALQSQFSDFASQTESVYDRITRLAKAATTDLKVQREAAFQEMSNSVTVQRARLTSMFESTFLSADFSGPFRAAVERIGDSVQFAATAIATSLSTVVSGFGMFARAWDSTIGIIKPLGFYTKPGDTNAQAGVRALVTVAETALMFKLPGIMQAGMQALGNAVVGGMGSFVGNTIGAFRAGKQGIISRNEMFSLGADGIQQRVEQFIANGADSIGKVVSSSNLSKSISTLDTGLLQLANGTKVAGSELADASKVFKAIHDPIQQLTGINLRPGSDPYKAVQAFKQGSPVAGSLINQISTMTGIEGSRITQALNYSQAGLLGNTHGTLDAGDLSAVKWKNLTFSQEGIASAVGDYNRALQQLESNQKRLLQNGWSAQDFNKIGASIRSNALDVQVLFSKYQSGAQMSSREMQKLYQLSAKGSQTLGETNRIVDALGASTRSWGAALQTISVALGWIGLAVGVFSLIKAGLDRWAKSNAEAIAHTDEYTSALRRQREEADRLVKTQNKLKSAQEGIGLAYGDQESGFSKATDNRVIRQIMLEEIKRNIKNNPDYANLTPPDLDRQIIVDIDKYRTAYQDYRENQRQTASQVGLTEGLNIVDRMPSELEYLGKQFGLTGRAASDFAERISSAARAVGIDLMALDEAVKSQMKNQVVTASELEDSALSYKQQIVGKDVNPDVYGTFGDASSWSKRQTDTLFSRASTIDLGNQMGGYTGELKGSLDRDLDFASRYLQQLASILNQSGESRILFMKGLGTQLMDNNKELADWWKKQNLPSLAEITNVDDFRKTLYKAFVLGLKDGIPVLDLIGKQVNNLHQDMKANMPQLYREIMSQNDGLISYLPLPTLTPGQGNFTVFNPEAGGLADNARTYTKGIKEFNTETKTIIERTGQGGASQTLQIAPKLVEIQAQQASLKTPILSASTEQAKTELQKEISAKQGLIAGAESKRTELMAKYDHKTFDEVLEEEGPNSKKVLEYKEALDKIDQDLMQAGKDLLELIERQKVLYEEQNLAKAFQTNEEFKPYFPIEEIREVGTSLQSLSTAVSTVKNNFDTLGDTVTGTDSNGNTVTDSVDWTDAQRKAYTQAHLDMETAMKAQSEAINDATQHLLDSLTAQSIAWDDYNKAVKKANGNLDDPAVKEAKSKLDEANAKLTQSATDLKNTILTAKNAVNVAIKAFDDILRELSADAAANGKEVLHNWIEGRRADLQKARDNFEAIVASSESRLDEAEGNVSKRVAASQPGATDIKESDSPDVKRIKEENKRLQDQNRALREKAKKDAEDQARSEKERADAQKALRDSLANQKKRQNQLKPKKGGAKPKKDTGKAERELLQQITQEHQERLQDIASFYKTVRDSEGKIIGYMDRTGGIENQQAVIEEQKRYLVDLKNVHEKMTKNAKDRAKVSRQIAQETVKLLEMERKLYEYQEKIQQNTNKYALEDLDRPHKLAIDTADIESLNALLQQEYDLQLKILDSEMRLTRQDEASVQAMRRKFSTEILKRYEAGLRDIIKVVQQLTDRFDTLQRMSPGGMQDFLLQQRIKYPELFGKGNTAVYDRQVQAITESVARQVDYAVEKANFKMDQLNTRFKQARQMMQLGANNFAEKAGVTQEEAAATYKALSEAFKARLDNKEISQQEYDKLIQVLQEGGATPIRTNVSATEMNQALESFKSNVESTASKLGVDPDLQAKLVAILQDTFISKLQGMFADSETIDPRKVIEEATAIKAKLESELKGELPTSVYNQIIQLLDSAIKSIAGEGGVKAIEMASKYSADIANLQAKMQAGEITKDFFDQVVAVYHQMLARLFTGAEVNADQLTALNEELATKKKALAERASKQTISSSYTTEPTVKMPAKYSATVTEMGGKYNVSPALIAAIIQNESGWKPRAKSPVGARGLMQLMPDTAKWLGVKNAWDPTQNIEGGTKYLAYLLKLFNGDIEKVIASYNAGQGRVQKSIKGGKLVKSTLPEETQTYLQRVLASFKGYGGVATGVAVPDSQLALDTQVIDAQQAELNKLKADFDSLVTITSISDQINKSNLLEEYTTTVDALIQEIVKGTEQLSQLDLSKIKNWQKVEIPLLEGKHTMMDSGLVSSLNQRIIEISTVVYQITEENYKESMAKLAVLMPHVKGIFDKLAEIPAEVIHEKLPYIQETIASQVVPAAQQLATHTMDDINRRYEEFKRTIADALESGWDEGWSIGEEYGFTSEGWGALQDSIKKRITSTIKNVLWEHLQPKIHEFFVGIFSVVDEQAQQDAIQKAQEAMQEAATEEARKAAQKKMQEALNPSQFLKPTFFGNLFGGLFAGIFSSLLSFAIGALFSDFTEEAQRIAQQQLDSQKDQIRSEGFSWSYSDPSSNVATPTYEFASPTTTESVKIIKVATTINISTDAAMAMASHRRELERVVSELIQAYERQVAKTVGANL